MNQHLPEGMAHTIAMQLGSTALYDAIIDARRGRNPGTGNKLIWGGCTQSWSTPKYYRAEVHVRQKEEALNRVVSRDPCFKCGVRADIGCRHQ